MKRVCFLIPVLVAGGAERVMSEIISYFSLNTNSECHLLLYGKKKEVFYNIPKAVNIHQSKINFSDTFRLLSAVQRLFYLRKKLNEIKPDAILSFGEIWNNFVLLSTVGLKYPIFVSDRCQPNKSLGKLQDYLRSRLYPRSAGVICQTQTAKEIYQNIFKHDNFVVIANPIRSFERLESSNKENVVLSVGRLIESKHFDELIHIFSDIYAPDWKLVIVGDDPLKQKNKEKLEILVRKLELQDRVELVGKQFNVETFYNKAKIFAFTSSSEGFPNVIGEAMSAGLPVVAYDCVAGPSDLIQHGKSGYLIKLHDKKGFKEALHNLIKDENLRIKFGREAKEIIQEYSTNKIGQQFEKTILIESSSN